MMKYLFKSSLFVFFLLFFLNSFSQDTYFSLGNAIPSTGRFFSGFKRVYTFDATRSYPLNYNPGINPDSTRGLRPMVINIWYPVKIKTASTFAYTQYLQFENADPKWKNFLTRLEHYQEVTIKENGFRYTKVNDTVEENILFNKLKQSKVAASLNATVAEGIFPLVIYQPSLGGTIEENALLCQYLAANGYVVISAAYQPDNGVRIGPDWDLERAEADVDYLVEYAQEHLPVDTNNIHLLGYSFGAQSVFNLLAKGRKFVSAVSLDSRLEYSFDYAPRGFKDLPDRLLSHVKNITQPVLLFTNEEATYKLVDSFVFANRYYMPLHFLEHHDYASTREISNYWVAAIKNKDRELLEKTQDYISMCEHVLAFLNFYTQPQNRKRDFLFPKRSRSRFAEHVPRGSNGNRTAADVIQTPRQLLLTANKIGVNHAKEIYKQQQMSFSEDFFNNYAYHLVGKDKGSMAIQVLVWAVEIYPNSANLFDSLGEIYFSEKEYVKSASSFRRSLALNPSNKNAIEYLKKLGQVK
ncbi:hypothetical protein [Sphingobacterium sp.]|uniref:hypothetical protein n=1 Tax=Sphingobacterium sp. TaxID=341027 RepID=UPI0031D65844